jgi:hypothetical protein
LNSYWLKWSSEGESHLIGGISTSRQISDLFNSADLGGDPE